jgi:Uma2 family endonuclease
MGSIPFEYRHLPTAEDLPDSDDTPVDNELQNHIPNILLNTLVWIWGDRSDWFFGVDMCIYYVPNDKSEIYKSIVPEGFLALGVRPRPTDEGRSSYVLWEEHVLPIMVLEVVSHIYRGEYDLKLEEYKDLGILYYVVYNPLSGSSGLYENHQSLEVRKLGNDGYQLIEPVSISREGGKMVWMPEVGLGIGCEQAIRCNWEREWVYWYDRHGIRHLPALDLLIERERLAKQNGEAEVFAQQENQQREKLVAYLRSLGINPDEI